MDASSHIRWHDDFREKTMKRNTSMVRHGVSALFVALLSLSAAAQETDPNVRAIDSTRTLIETSSSAKQIEQSKVPEALARRNDARDLLKKAEAARLKGDVPEMNRLLTEAKKQLFAAVKLANPDEVTSEKKARDYETRLNSVKALRDALARDGKVKNEAALRAADTNLADAARFASEKKYDQARASVEWAYAAIKAANIGQRDGTEVVDSKNFATKEDEYKYEIGRNNEYQQLSEAVLSNMAPNLATMYKPVGEKALGIRKEAENEAGKKEFAAAVTGMERSTAEYKKIIRAGGIPVP